MYPFIVKVKYWDDFSTPYILNHTHLLVYADDMAGAVAYVERANYVPNIEEMKIMSAGDVGQFFEVPGHIADIFCAGGGDFREGLRQVKSAKVRQKLMGDVDLIEVEEDITNEC